MYKSIFDFNNEEKQFFLEYINDEILLNIGRLNITTAILYFTDEMGDLINIPSNIIIYEYKKPIPIWYWFKLILCIILDFIVL